MISFIDSFIHSIVHFLLHASHGDYHFISSSYVKRSTTCSPIVSFPHENRLPSITARMRTYTSFFLPQYKLDYPMLLAIYWNETIVSPSFVACTAPHTKINECNLPVHNFINSISFEMAHNFSVGSIVQSYMNANCSRVLVIRIRTFSMNHDKEKTKKAGLSSR